MNNPLLTQTVLNAVVKNGLVTNKSSSLDDRIINLRFFHSPSQPGLPMKTFTIRSDYEPNYTQNGFEYVMIKQKPSITVRFVYVANDTLVGLEIEVGNLYIDNQNYLEANSEWLKEVEIEMGYRSQLPDYLHDSYYASRTLGEFMALTPGAVNSSTTSYAVSPGRIKAQILSVQKKSTPPDLTVLFTCVVGTADPGLIWNGNLSEIDADSYQADVSSKWPIAPQNYLPKIFFGLITKRFVRSNVYHNISSRVNINYGNFLQSLSVTQSLTIYPNNSPVPIQLVLDGDGRMSNGDADKYGVTAHLSRMLWEMPVNEIQQFGISSADRAKMKPIEQAPPTQEGETLPQQVNLLLNDFPFIRCIALGNGDIFFFHADEAKPGSKYSLYDSARDLIQSQPITLPAVYDITWGGTRTIRAPYIPGIGPMSIVAFQTSYALNDLAGNFYYPKESNSCYLVITAKISFSTDGTENEMSLMCTDTDTTLKLPETSVAAVPTTNPVTGAIVAAPAIPLNTAPARTQVWQTKKTVAGTNWTWVIWQLKSNTKGPWAKDKPDIHQMLSDLKAWNPDLATSSVAQSQGYDPQLLANGLTGPSMLTYQFPKISPTQTITYRIPYLPSYDPTQGQ